MIHVFELYVHCPADVLDARDGIEPGADGVVGGPSDARVRLIRCMTGAPR